MDAACETDAKMDEDTTLDSSSLKGLKAWVATLREDRSAVHRPELAFFKEFLEEWGAKIPEEPPKREAPEPVVEEPEEDDEEESEEREEPLEPEPESPEEPEEEDAGRLPEDEGPYPELGPPGETELGDEQLDAQGSLKQAAAEALEDGKPEEAVQKLTEAIQIGNPTAIMYAKRAEVLLKLRRPRACIADATAAIAVNPNSGKAHRLRGKALRALGLWEDAHKDLSMGQQLDYDEDTVEVHRLVDEKWKRISEGATRKRVRAESWARREQEREIKRRRKAAKKAQEKAQAYQEAKRRKEAGGAAYEGSPVDMGSGSGSSTGGPKIEEVHEEGDAQEMEQ
uniref:Hsp70-interacting protein N-terminal domain-containing protein n=2 Tax=Alexandrium catenella TaxID=2925 RepID=A0A7S1MEB3_ALECA